MVYSLAASAGLGYFSACPMIITSPATLDRQADARQEKLASEH
jgi:hypothetical protein